MTEHKILDREWVAIWALAAAELRPEYDDTDVRFAVAKATAMYWSTLSTFESNPAEINIQGRVGGNARLFTLKRDSDPGGDLVLVLPENA